MSLDPAGRGPKFKKARSWAFLNLLAGLDSNQQPFG